MTTPAFLQPPRHEALLSLSVRPEIATLLDSIPSETVGNERRFLYKFFNSIWNGRGHVIEIGPFLGGTTRAMALGIEEHADADADAVILTLDKFKDYYSAANLREYIAPLIANGTVPDFPLTEDTAFLHVFEKFHAHHDYFKRIRPATYSLPDTRAELEEMGLPELPPTGEVSAVFVDGCKSWFGTKVFMQEMAARTAPGAFFLFQDYAWYTCFWLPSFIALFHEKFELWGHVETTYVFRLREKLDAEEIEKRFPDTPEEIGMDAFWDLFQGRIQAARDEGDAFGETRAEMQLAASFAYIGKKIRARNRLRILAESPLAVGHEALIAAALKAPTYRPDGPIFLPQED